MMLTQAALAEKLHVSDKTISKWETGTSLPDLSLLKTISEALNVPVSLLLAADEWNIISNTDEPGDSAKIERFGQQQIIALMLFVIPVFGMIFGLKIYPTVGVVLFKVIPFTMIVSIGLFAYNSLMFHAWIKKGPRQEKQDRIFVFYIRLYLHSILLAVSLFSVLIQSMNGTPHVFWVTALYLIIFWFSVEIAKRNGFSFIMDRTNRILTLFYSMLIAVFLMLQLLIFKLDFFFDLGVDVFSVVSFILNFKWIYEIGPIILSFVITQRMVYTDTKNNESKVS